MFGLTFEKLFLIALVAVLVIGPSRLPEYTRQLTQWLRSIADIVREGRAEAERDLGISMTRAEWEALDPRQYNPRRIVQEALAPATEESPTDPMTDPRVDEAAHVRPGQQYIVSGTASHPRRVLIASLPRDDPRRLAAETTDDVEPDDEAVVGVAP